MPRNLYVEQCAAVGAAASAALRGDTAGVDRQMAIAREVDEEFKRRVFADLARLGRALTGRQV